MEYRYLFGKKMSALTKSTFESNRNRAGRWMASAGNTRSSSACSENHMEMRSGDTAYAANYGLNLFLFPQKKFAF